MAIKELKDMDCAGKIVVIRQDLNVPMKDGRITNDKRIRAALPGIRLALEKGAGVVLLSHLGRPTEGEFDPKFSLAPVAEHLSGLLGKAVPLAADIDSVKVAPGEVVLLENVRFFKGEKKNDPDLAARLAALGDIYVMDAFGAAHRAHSSTEGAIRKARVACAGPLMMAELNAFAKVLDHPSRPLVAVIGGSKVSTKLSLLENLLDKVDCLIVGGGIANTFLAAKGYNVQKSLYEPELLDDARRIMQAVPSDVLVLFDEAYIQFNTAADTSVAMDLFREYPNVVVAHTFSKAYGLAGLRIGYAIAPADVVEGMSKVALPFGVTETAQVAAVASLDAQEELDERVRAIIAERDRVVAALREQGWEFPTPYANYFWLPLGERTGQAAAAFTEQGLSTRVFPGEGVRISVGEPEANDLVIKVCAELKAQGL